MKHQFEELEKLGQMVFDIEMARLKSWSDAIGKQRDRLEELDRIGREKPATKKTGTSLDDLIWQEQQRDLWKIWSQRERQQILAEIATLAAKREAQQLAARKALGRLEAMRQLRAFEGRRQAWRDR